MPDFLENPKLIVEIYKYISPVFIWIETMDGTLKENDTFKQIEIFHLLKEIRNEASHLNIYQNKRNESLFIKIVTTYKRFGLNLIEKSQSIKRIWNRLHNNLYKRHSVLQLKDELEDFKLDYYGKYEENLNLFKSILFSILVPNENDENQYQINLINIIFQYISPIIIWHEKMINPIKTDSKLFLLVDEIKNRVCHLSYTNHENCTHLQEILKSIVVVYKIFGVDLTFYNSKINEIDFETIRLCIEYKENEIREEIIEILSNENDMQKNHYESFEKLIDMFVVELDENEVINKNVSDHASIEKNDNNEKYDDGKQMSNTKSIWELIKSIFCLNNY